MSSRYVSSSRPLPTASSSRTSMSSDSSSSSTSSSYYDQTRYSSDSPQPRVEVMRCSRCAKSVETVASGSAAEDASASGMVRFGHNLYYCDRCAKMVGYT